MIEGRSAAGLCDWLADCDQAWLNGIAWATLDLSGPLRLALDTMLPGATQVADPFHMVKLSNQRLANQRLDELRRRVKNETLGRRGHKQDPLYLSHRLLAKADEHLDGRGRTRLLGLLNAGDPHSEVRTAWHAIETVRGIYEIDDPDLASDIVGRLGHDLQDETCPPQIRQHGRTIVRWRHHLAAWHQTGSSDLRGK